MLLPSVGIECVDFRLPVFQKVPPQDSMDLHDRKHLGVRRVNFQFSFVTPLLHLVARKKKSVRHLRTSSQ